MLPCELGHDLRVGENITDEFKARYPFGRVPVLELDDGTYLAESNAICLYLERLHPEPNLFGETPLEQAQVEMWGRRVQRGRAWARTRPA